MSDDVILSCSTICKLTFSKRTSNAQLGLQVVLLTQLVFFNTIKTKLKGKLNIYYYLRTETSPSRGHVTLLLELALPPLRLYSLQPHLIGLFQENAVSRTDGVEPDVLVRQE